MRNQILFALCVTALMGCGPSRTPEQEAAEMAEASARIQEAMIANTAAAPDKLPKPASEASAPAASPAASAP